MVEVFLTKNLSSWADRYCGYRHKRWIFATPGVRSRPPIDTLGRSPCKSPPSIDPQHAFCNPLRLWTVRLARSHLTALNDMVACRTENERVVNLGDVVSKVRPGMR
jgi:hypothetical protein